MAKENKEKPPVKKYSDSDVAEFIEELEGGMTDETSAESEQPSLVTESKSVKKGKKIPVQAEPDDAPKPRVDPEAPLPAAMTPKSSKDMKHMTKAKRQFPWAIVIGAVAVLAVASVGGFFFFNQTKKFSNDSVQLQFASVADVTSGGEMTIVVEYQNLERVDITNAELNLLYPDGFTFSESTPTTTSEFHNSFSLGTINSGEAGQVTIVGTLLGGVGEKATFSATLAYRPSNFNSDFQQQASTEVTIGSSTLRLALDGPTQLAPGAEGTWSITYTNTSDHDVKDVEIAAVYPDALTLASTKPTTADHKTWKIASIKKDGSGTITFTGTVNGSIGDTLLLKVTAGLSGTTTGTQLQDEQSLLVLLIKTGVAVQVAVNGSTDPVTIQPGDSLTYSLQILNSSDVELTNVVVTAKVDGTAVDFTTLSNDSSAAVKDQTLTWTSKEIAGLSSFKPGQAATLSFNVGTKATLPMAADGDKDQHVTLTVDVSSDGAATSSNTNSSASKLTQPSTVVVTKIATILGLTAEARFYDDAKVAVGSGPVPPVVGSTTTYRIILKVTNTTSDASSFVVSAQLPNSVLWTGQNLARDAGTLAFDPTTRTVQWTINTVPAGTGKRVPALTAHFDVSITPTSDQVDTVPILIEAPAATATDAYSKAALTSSVGSLTTDLPTDPTVAHQGTVVAK